MWSWAPHGEQCDIEWRLPGGRVDWDCGMTIWIWVKMTKTSTLHVLRRTLTSFLSYEKD